MDNEEFGSYEDADLGQPDDNGTHNDYGDDAAPNKEQNNPEDNENPDEEQDDSDEEQDDSEKGQAKNIEKKVSGNNPLDKFKNMFDSKKNTAHVNHLKGVAKRAAGKASGKTMLHVIKFLFTPPILWFTLAVLVVAVFVLGVIMLSPMIAGSAAAPQANMDPANGQFGTAFGITGDKFYGGRYIYLDPEQSQNDLKANYEAFSENFLDAVDNLEYIDLNVSIDKANVTLEMSEMIAKAVSGSTETITFEEHISLVDHFGYTNVELDTIQTSFVEYVNNNKTALLTISEDYSGNLEEDLNALYDSTFDSYNITSPLYYVKDVILDGDEGMLPSQEPFNYVAFIFMPKTEVFLESNSFAFYFPEGEDVIDNYATEIKFEFISMMDDVETIETTETIDSTWWQNGTVEKNTETSLIISPIPTFASIDTENPIKNKSIYSLLFTQDNNTQTEDEEVSISYQNFSMNELKKRCSLTEVQEEDLNYFEISYLPTNDSTYLYIRLEANGIFQFCELESNFVSNNEAN